MRANVGVMKIKSTLSKKDEAKFQKEHREWRELQKKVLRKQIKRLQVEEKQMKRRLESFKLYDK